MLDDLTPQEDESIALDLGAFARKKDAVRNLSGAAFIGEYLYLANDEGKQLLRLKRRSLQHYAQCKPIGIRHLFDFQQDEIDADAEFDLEALAIETRDEKTARLWLIGSHAMGHEKPTPSDLEEVGLVRARNRLLFGCVEVDERGRIVDDRGRHLRIRRTGQTWTTRFLSALRGAPPPAVGFLREASALSMQTIPRAIAQNIGWFTPYTLASTKENGLDIEGLAIRRREDRSKVVALVGLRGPVVGGLAVVVEIEIRDYNERRLRPDGEPRFHLLNLQGLGVRDLEWRGDDLLILAGPTMTRQNESTLFCWRQAWRAARTPGGANNVVGDDALFELGRLPMKDTSDPSADAADGIGGPEAITAITPGGDSYMVLRDGIKGSRLAGSTYRAEVYRVEAVTVDTPRRAG